MNFYENDSSSAAFIIQRASEGVLLINGEVYTQTVLITAEGLSTWSMNSLSELTQDFLERLIAAEPELILIGTGAKMQRLAPELLQLCYAKHIGVDMMDTPAAARTYNLLAQEGRVVIALLILTNAA